MSSLHMRGLWLAPLCACGGGSPRPVHQEPPPARPVLPSPPQDRTPGDVLDAPDEPELAVESLQEQLDRLAGELETACGDPTRLRDLRARAEQLTGEPAVVGIAASLIAAIPGSRLRVITDPGVTVVDTSGEPVLWVDTHIEHRPCPPCSSDARTIVAFALSPRIVGAMAIDVGKGVLLDLTTPRILARPEAVLGSTLIAPDRKRLAFVNTRFDDSDPANCIADITFATAAGVTPGSSNMLPPDLCQGNVDAVWRGKNIILSSEWSADVATVDVVTGAVTIKPAKARPAARIKHLSRPLCGAKRKPFEAAGCTVARRFVFPTIACAGAKVDPDPDPGWYCQPGVPPP